MQRDRDKIMAKCEYCHDEPLKKELPLMVITISTDKNGHWKKIEKEEEVGTNICHACGYATDLNSGERFPWLAHAREK